MRLTARIKIRLYVRTEQTGGTALQDVQYSKSDVKALLISTCAAAMVVPLMSTMLNLALVSIGADFGVGSHDLGYVNTFFLLGSVIGMVPASRIASIRGMRKVFRLGLLLTLISSVLLALSPSFPFLMVMRLVVGIVSSLTLVTAVASITYVVPIEHRGWALGINTTAVYIGLSLGPFFGGVICDAVGWRFVFVVVAAVAAVALSLSRAFKHEIVPQPDRPMDWVGAVGWAVSMFVLMIGVVNAGESWAPIAIAVGAVLLVLEIIYLDRSENPVFSVRLFRNRGYATAAISTFMNYGASYSISFFMALYLQSIGALSATEAGLIMLVQPAMQVLLTARAGALYDKLPDKRTLPAIGALVTAIGVAMFLFLGTKPDFVYVAVTLVVCGIGSGIFSSPMTALIMSSVPPEDRGDASGTVSLMRQTGMMVSMGIAMACITFIMGSTDNLGPATYGLFTDTIHAAFSICLVMCIVGLLCTLSSRRRHD